jgi:ubiquinone/menaquinone biosynthesis C-methylase UbiE
MSDDALAAVRDYWEDAACGEELYLGGTELEDYERQAAERYRLEPCIESFAEFERYRGRRVLEIGVGLGADHRRFAEAGAELSGIDLTERAIRHVRHQLALRGLNSDLRVGNAERLDFADASFDLVYSWGVLHHTPDTHAAVCEVLRVLKPGGEAKVMIYNQHSLVGFMLWLRYALARGRPRTSLDEIYREHLESPGTKAYTVDEARRLFSDFNITDVHTELTHADLLSSSVGQRHRGALLSVARRIWPRWLIRRLFRRNGLFLVIIAQKPSGRPTAPSGSGS